jgi:acetylornithine/succinyldiaminopimelate/putrescine aminotransferase
MMFEFLPLLYAAIGGGAVAVVGSAAVHKAWAERKSRLLRRMTRDAQDLQSMTSGDEAAEIAARLAREAKQLEQLKIELAKL